jgi:hypothetical protein
MAEEQKFKVNDRRGFTEDGTSKPVTETPAEAPPSAEVSKEASEPRDRSKNAYQQIDFPTYILGYYTQGLVLLGETPNPYTQKKEEDVESVRHIIDVLSMIEQKTKGNLNNEESQLLKSVLYELRMKFMTKTSRIKL